MGSPDRRRCPQCGTVLSRSNAGTHCAPCQRDPIRRLDPAFWADPVVRTAAAEWDFGVVVRLFRKHTGLSQAAVARLVNIDQAEVSRLERGLKKIRDRRQLAQWGEALGIPSDLMRPLPAAERPETGSDGVNGYLPLSDGPGQVLLPAGRNQPLTALPALAAPAITFRGNSLWLSTTRELEAWTRMPQRALVIASRVIDGRHRHFAADARGAVSRTPSADTIAVPAAYELDDLTYGILWAVAGFDSALLGDDAALHDLLDVEPKELLQAGAQRALRDDLTDGAQMLIGSQTCASFILQQRHDLGDRPVFWTREQKGEEAATWLFFRHKLRYLQLLSPANTDSGVGRAFCIPQQAVDPSPTYERVLLFLAIALMESYGVTTWVTEEPDLQQTDGFVLAPGHRAAIATWVRTEAVPRAVVTAGPRVLRSFADATGFAKTHTVTPGTTPGVRLAATADYLGLDRAWLMRRCRQLAVEGTVGLARPRSRHLGVEALNTACGYAAAQLQPGAGAVPSTNR